MGVRDINAEMWNGQMWNMEVWSLEMWNLQMWNVDPRGVQKDFPKEYPWLVGRRRIEFCQSMALWRWLPKALL